MIFSFEFRAFSLQVLVVLPLTLDDLEEFEFLQINFADEVAFWGSDGGGRGLGIEDVLMFTDIENALIGIAYSFGAHPG